MTDKNILCHVKIEKGRRDIPHNILPNGTISPIMINAAMFNIRISPLCVVTLSITIRPITINAAMLIIRKSPLCVVMLSITIRAIMMNAVMLIIRVSKVL
jgi:hypothetical protein